MKKQRKANSEFLIKQLDYNFIQCTMEDKYFKYSFFIMFFVYLSFGCDDYVRTEVTKDIYVNKLSLSAFVGDQIQLIASPTDETYQYKWSSEDTNVATVDEKGLVQIVGEGSTNIIVSDGNASRQIPVTAIIRIPLTDVILSETSLELLPGARKTILVTNVPDNANDIPPYNWYSENPDIVTVNEIGELTVVGEGTTNIIYCLGEIEKKVSIDAAYTRPFMGPHVLSAAKPCEIPAANFDLGGEGYAFHDADAANRTNNNYRRNNGDPLSDAVDIEGNGVNIGYTNVGEWLLYTVEVQDAGEYFAEISLSANGINGKYRLEVDGENVTGTVIVPNNGSWGDWRWHPVPPLEINLPAGKHKIKFFFEGSDFNLRALRFTKK